MGRLLSPCEVTSFGGLSFCSGILISVTSYVFMSSGKIVVPSQYPRAAESILFTLSGLVGPPLKFSFLLTLLRLLAFV